MPNLLPARQNPPNEGDDEPRVLINVGLLPDFLEGATDDRPSARVNLKALIVLLSLLALLPPLYFPIMKFQEGRLRRLALAQARAFADDDKLDRALMTLEHHLGNWPEDIPAMELQAQLMTEAARAPDEILRAANIQDQLLRIDPMGPGRQENRRQLVELYLRYGEWLRYTTTKKELWIDRFQNRYRTAVKIAQQRIQFGNDDAVSHRLMAMALEGLASMGDAKSLTESTIEYEKALRRDPGDAVSAERLALLNLEKRNDRAGADEILEELVQAKPDSPKVRLVRYRYFRKTLRDEKAQAELASAIRLAPTDLEVRVAAAADALRRDDTASARRHLDAMPEASRDDPKLLVLRGQIELVEHRPDDAIESWRKGLAAVGGRDKELAWQLASTLIRYGRFAEAKPLVDRFGQLVGDDSNPMARLLRGSLKERTGHVAAAVADLEPAKASIGPEMLVELAMTLGRCYEALGDDAKAMLEYRRALDAAPLAAYPRRVVARLQQKSDPAKAADELEAGLKLVSDPAPLLIDLASIRIAQQKALPPANRKWKVVEEVLDRLEKAAPRDLEVQKVRADYLFSSGKPDQAIDLLEGLARGPARDRDEYWLTWATGLASRGQVAEALQVLEEGSALDNAGEHAASRIARARLLVRTGRARQARELLTKDVQKIPVHERAALARARAEIFHELGDQAGARDACLEWSRLAPDDPQPGLTLLTMAQQGGGDEAARLGLEVLHKVGGEDEPYALAARALDLLISTRAREETRSARFDQAAKLVEQLQGVAPQLPVSFLLRGIVLERNHRIEEAITSYRAALRGNARGMALPRLVALLVRLRRYGDLADLKESTGESAAIDQFSTVASMGEGDKERALQVIGQIIESQPDSLEMRATQVRLMGELGKPKEAEAVIRDLIKRRADQPGPWIALAIFQATQGHAAEVARTIEQAREGYKGPKLDLLIARCLWIANDKGAASAFDEAIAARPDDQATLKVAADYFEAIGRLDRAEAILRQAWASDSRARWAARRLAPMLAARPNPASWAEAWALVGPGGPAFGDAPDDRLARVAVLERSPDVNRRAEAGAEFAALADDLPASHPIAIEARRRLARAYLDSNRPVDAARAIAPLVGESSAASPTALALATEALARSGHAEEAGRMLARLTSIEPESPRSTACRAWTFHAQGKDSDAAALIEEAVALAEGKPEESTAAVAYFNLLLKLDLPEPAERIARRIAGRRPAEAWILAGYLAGRSRDAEALEACRTAGNAGSRRESTRVVVGLAASRRLDARLMAEAVSIGEDALSRSPDDLSTLSLVTALRHFSGRFEEELALHRRGLELDPANVSRLNDMAWILSECVGRPEEGLRKIDEAIRRGGKGPQYDDTRGVILTRLGRYDEAIAELERASRARPIGTYYFHLARASLKAGRSDLFEKNRELARKAGIDTARLEPSERADYAAVIGR